MNSLEKLLTVVEQAGTVLLEKWPGNDNRSLDIELKQDGSAVTEADYASNDILVAALKEYFPNDGIISEELPRKAGMSERESVWIIDPLDGTQSFIDGKNDFSILMARVQNHVVIESIMLFPAMGLLATARLGQGAYINGEKISVADTASLQDHSVYIRNFENRRKNCAYPNHLDSGRAFLAVARGEIAAAVMKMGRHQEWDLAAPALLISEAGGRISDEEGNPVLFNQSAISYEYFCASNAFVHGELRELLPSQ